MTFRSGLLVGFIAGAALGGLAFLFSRISAPPPPPKEEHAAPAAPPPAILVDLERAKEENRRLAQQVADLERAAKAPAPVPPPKEEKPAEAAPADLKERFAKLAEMGLAAFRSPDLAKTLELIKSSGKPAIEFLMDVLRNSPSATERFMASALLEGGGDASTAAVPALADALKSDKDMMVRRMAAHALAVLGTSAAEEPLRAAATADADWGVRVNSAYGLAKLKNDEGLRILQSSYESPNTPAEYRLAILGGLADVAAPASAPLFRRILADSKDESYLLMAIGALEKSSRSSS